MQLKSKKPKLLLIIPLLALSILPLLASSIPRANAVGLVCLTDTTATSCPTSAPTLFAAQGSQLMVAVQIASTDQINGFDIQIHTDNTVLQAADASLTNSIITSGGAASTTLVKCLDGVLVTGPRCSATDGAGVLHFAVVRQGSTVLGNGLLFTAIYNVLAKTPSLAITFNTGCTGTSVPDGTCVTIVNGTTTTSSETVQGAIFSNLTDFTITSSPTSLVIAPGVTGTTTITLTSFGGYTDFVTLTVAPSGGLTASLADSALGGEFLPADGTASTTLSVSAAVSGSYVALVTGTGTNPAFTHSVTVPVLVTPQAFTVTANPTSLNIAPGSSGTSTITVAPVAGFTGTVSLVATVTPAGPTAALSMSSIVLGASQTSTLTITVPTGTASGAYTVTVTGTSGVSHAATVALNVGQPTFTLGAIPDTIGVLRVKPSAHAGVVLHLSSINNFAGPVTFTVSWNFAFIDTPGGSSLPFTLTPSGTFNLLAGQSALIQFDIFPVAANTGTGLYKATVTATSGTTTRIINVDWWILDFTVTPLNPGQTSITVINRPGVIAQEAVVIQPIGAPHNATGDIINDIMTFGPSGNAGAMSYPIEYGAGTPLYRSTVGARFNATLGLDSTLTPRRCFALVYNSIGNLVLPVYLNSQVRTFAAPVVHYNGDQDGDPPNFDGCRFDGIWAALPSTPDHGFITFEPIATTPMGTFTALPCFQVGPLINCVPFTVRMVPPPVPPAINQFSGRTGTVSLSATGGLVTFKVGFTNRDATATIYAQFTITAVSSDGLITIQGSSAIVTLGPNGKVNNVPVTLNFNGVAAGTTFNLRVVVHYGVDPNNLTEISTATIGSTGKLNGSIILVP